MISRLTTIQGLGGTGKTHKIAELCEAYSKIGRQVIYVTFNKDTATKTKTKIKLPGVHISTIHALAYQELKRVDQVPEDFKVKTLNLEEPTASNESFKTLISNFLAFFNTNDLPSLKERLVLIVDEFQNVGSDLMEVLKLIWSKHEVELYLVGDRNQALYSYLETHRADNFRTIEETFCHPIDQRIILTKNHRSSPSIQSVINGFLVRNLKAESKELYDTEDSITEPQELLFFTNRQEEFSYVKEEAFKWHEETGKRVAIIARSKRNMSLFQDWKDQNQLEWLVLSTIHAYIGNEADRVFIVGFENSKDREENKIYYTGLIRAEERLTITTSFPHFDVPTVFDPATVKAFSSQRTLSQLLGPMKPIMSGQQLTREMFDACMIDSITLAVRGDDIPFSRYIKLQEGTEDNPFAKSQIITTPDGIEIKITYNAGTKAYYFELKDVNLLRSNWYADAEVVSFLTNFVLMYFNFQIVPSQIHLHSIDLCKLVEEDHELIGLLKREGLKFHSRLDHEGKVITKFSMDEIQQRSVYYNFNTKNNKALTLDVYRPINKENAGRLLDPKAIKLELRYLRSAVESKYAFGGDAAFIEHSGTKKGEVVMSVDRLLRRLGDDDGLLDSVYMATIRFKSIKGKSSRSGKRRSVKRVGGMEPVGNGERMEAVGIGGWGGQDGDVVEDEGVRAISRLYEIENQSPQQRSSATIIQVSRGMLAGIQHPWLLEVRERSMDDRRTPAEVPLEEAWCANFKAI